MKWRVLLFRLAHAHKNCVQASGGVALSASKVCFIFYFGAIRSSKRRILLVPFLVFQLCEDCFWLHQHCWSHHKLPLCYCSGRGTVVFQQSNSFCGPLLFFLSQAVKDEELRLVPKFHDQTWFKWLENIRCVQCVCAHVCACVYLYLGKDSY